MIEKEYGSWNRLEHHFITLRRTPEVLTGWSTVPCCYNRMLCVGSGLLHVETEFLKLEYVGIVLYMLERNFRSWNRTLSVDTDSYESWEITLKLGTGWNRNLQVGTQLIDGGKGL